MTEPTVTLPAELLPRDARFGSGPSRIRPQQLAALTERWAPVLGTSHRQAPVRDLVGRVRRGLADLLSLPDGYEIVLGNGGSTTFWDVATFGLIGSRSQHVSIGEFSAKFAAATTAAPFLQAPSVLAADPGQWVGNRAEAGVDAYCWPHNETSTGVLSPVRRVPGTASTEWGEPLMIVDATSAAGGVEVDLSETDVYYFAPQKALGSDGGLWFAALSPTALERADRAQASGRWTPASLDLVTAIKNSRQEQTYNTPALVTLALLCEQVEWLLAGGGLPWAAARSRANSDHVYRWADERAWATPFVRDPAHRSPVVTTIDLDGVDSAVLTSTLRANGVLDTEPYRGLGRNQLRLGLFPSVELADVQALTDCVDYLVERLSA